MASTASTEPVDIKVKSTFFAKSEERLSEESQRQQMVAYWKHHTGDNPTESTMMLMTAKGASSISGAEQNEIFARLGDIKGKTVLIRCDLNVPLNSDLKITDETRITASIPTIEYLSKKGAKVLACSHLGRPKDGPEEKFSLKPVAKRMGELMKKDVKCAPDCKATDEVKAMVSDLSEGEVLILENTRFYKGETKNDAELAESMASLADLFVNDAFGTAHRAHSSTEGVTKFLTPCVSGLLLIQQCVCS